MVRYNGLVWSSIAVPVLLPSYIDDPCCRVSLSLKLDKLIYLKQNVFCRDLLHTWGRVVTQFCNYSKLIVSITQIIPIILYLAATKGWQRVKLFPLALVFREYWGKLGKPVTRIISCKILSVLLKHTNVTFEFDYNPCVSTKPPYSFMFLHPTFHDKINLSFYQAPPISVLK